MFQTALKCFCHERFCKDGKTKRFTCRDCGVNFRNKQGLEQHGKRHKKPGGFFCSSCDAQFTSTTARLQHYESEHRVLYCHICKAKCTNPANYVKHIVNVHCEIRCKIKEEENPDTVDDVLEEDTPQHMNNDDPLVVKRELLAEEVFCSTFDEGDQTETKEEVMLSTASLNVTKEESLDIDDWPDADQLPAESESDHEAAEAPEPKKRKTTKQRMRPTIMPKSYACNLCDLSFCYPWNLIQHLQEIHKLSKDDENWPKDAPVVKGKKHGCKFCEKAYTARSQLLAHMKYHGRDGKLVQYCKICKQTFESKESFTNHRKTCYYSCALCTKIIYDKDTIRKHMRRVHGKVDKHPVVFKFCNKCPMKFKTKDDYQLHKESKCGKKAIFACEVCKKTFSLPSKLKVHMKIHTEKHLQCQYCDKAFRVRTHLHLHTKSMHSMQDKVLTCHHCSQTYSSENSFVKHMKTDHGIEMERPSGIHDCNYCRSTFLTKEKLDKHMEKKHIIDGKIQFKCPHCEEYFADETAVKEHAIAIHREQYECNFCNKTFTKQLGLSIHIRRVHSMKANMHIVSHLCGKCGKIFKSTATLKDHERSNCGQIPLYQCDVCEKYLQSSGSLKTHKATHLGLRPFPCQYCSFASKTHHQMKVHARTHTGEKPYTCSFCPKQFSNKEHLLTHLPTHTGYKRYLCSGCGERFTCSSNLRAHRKRRADTCGLVPNINRVVGPMEAPFVPKQEDGQ